MKTRFFLTILSVILFHCLGLAQITNEQLRENCLNDANYWKDILGLTDSEIEKMSNVLFTYHASVRYLSKDISN